MPKKYILFFLLFVPFCFISAKIKMIRPLVPSYQKEIYLLKSKMGEMEQELNKKQNLYLQQLQRVKELDGEVEKLSLQLENDRKFLEKRRKELQKLWKNYLPETSDEDSLENYYLQQLLSKTIKNYLYQIQKWTKENGEKQQELNQLKTQLFEYTTSTEEMEKILLDLENARKELMLSYQQQMKKNDVVNTEKRGILSTSSPLPFSITFPLLNYQSLEQGKKGITFHFSLDHTPLLSTGDGEVVYVGELSTYGKVIMIDHGQDLRSILLGHFLPKVEKNRKVKAGELLGYTVKGERKTGQIYLELRKKNQVQNIGQLITKKGDI